MHEPPAGVDLARAVLSAAVGLVVTDLRGRVLGVDEAFAGLLRRPSGEVLGRGLAEVLSSAEGAHDVEGTVARLLDGDPAVTGEVPVLRGDGVVFRARTLSSLATTSGGDAVVVLHLLDAHRERPRAPGDHDHLTRLPGRAAAVTDLTARLRAGTGLVGVLTCDLDRFRVVNESLGHAVGDEVLLTVARRLLAGVRGGDVVARLGDDEFAVVLAGLADAGEAVDVAHRLTRALAAPLEVPGPAGPQEIRCAVSTGLAVVDLAAPLQGAGPGAPELDAATLLRDANTALDAAKAAGGGCCRVFTDAMRRRAVRRLTVENDLRRALERGELRVHYQPVVRLADRRRTGFEALVRWEHPERGLLLPEEFLDVAEECGLVTAVDAAVLEEVLGFLARHPEGRVSVNTSARRLDGTFAPAVAHGLARHGLPPQRLAVELLETSLVPGDAVTERELHDLADLGVEVLLDDFGTGYSALSDLRRLPVGGLKLDRSFVGDLPADATSDRIAAAVVGLAVGFGLSSTCEGVETAAQAAHLAAQGWRSAQGSLFGAPAPEEHWFPSPAVPADGVRASA